MKLKGREKEIWWSLRQIKNSKDIPEETPGFIFIDNDQDDEFFLILTNSVKRMDSLFLKQIKITDLALEYISRLQVLKELTIIRQDEITAASLPYINKLVTLEFLDISLTSIQLADVDVLKDLVNLKELWVSSELDQRDKILEQVITLEQVLPNCKIFVNSDAYN
jgi:hypothetical protein